jgi:hypothetical protein
MWLIVIQVILNVSLVVFVRTCLDLYSLRGEKRRVPRILFLLLIIFSFAPIAGLVGFGLAIYILGMYGSADQISIKDNRFTRYWLKS